MSGNTSQATVASAGVLRKGPRRGDPPKPKQPVSREAQRTAAVILEVLAGVCTPTEAAVALSLTLPRYYLWEQRALEGLVRACEPRPVGKFASERHQIAVLEKEVARLRQNCARQQALVRASQRTIGLATWSSASKPNGKPGSKAPAKVPGNGKAKRKRRPTVRALKAVTALRRSAIEETASDSSSTVVEDVVQRSAPGSFQVTAEAPSAEAAASEV